MTTHRGWFSNLCNKCFSPPDEAKLEIDLTAPPIRSTNTERSPTMVYSLKPLNIPPMKATRADSDAMKSSNSTKENMSFNFETRLVHADTSASSPRNDLQLEVMESDYLEVGQKFRIKPNGSVDNVQTIKQGEVHIGTEPENGSESKEQENDIVCSKFKTGKPVQTARILIDKGCFMLEDLGGGGDGVYIKAEDKIQLENQIIVYYGIGHFFVQLLKGKDGSSQPRLKLKFLDGPNDGLEKIFESEDICTIGRLSTCTVVFDEYGVSRIQCKIFSENGHWYIKDGDGFKKSTNGTWILVSRKRAISSKTTFKVNNTVFKTQFLEL